jgi:hypothetical protein
VVQHGVELVALELVGREEADGFGVGLEDLVEELAGCFHAALFGALVDAELGPVDVLEGDVRVV